jgi:hypothetical protein
MVDDTHRRLVEVLESRCYKALVVKRYGPRCYLVIKLVDEDRVFVDRSGKRVEYRHAWQVRDWLLDRFAIPEHEVQVDVVPR